MNIGIFATPACRDCAARDTKHTTEVASLNETITVLRGQLGFERDRTARISLRNADRNLREQWRRETESERHKQRKWEKDRLHSR